MRKKKKQKRPKACRATRCVRFYSAKRRYQKARSCPETFENPIFGKKELQKKPRQSVRSGSNRRGCAHSPFFAQSRAPFLSEILANPEESLKIASVNANFRFCSHIGQLSLAYSPCRKETPPPTDNNAFRGASPCARTSDWIDCKPARAGRTRSGYLLQTTIFDGALHTPSCDAPSLVLREKLILQKNPAVDFKTIRRRDYLF